MFAEPLTLSEVPMPLFHLSFLTHGKSTKRPPREVKERRTLDSAERLIKRNSSPGTCRRPTSAAVPIIEPLNGPKASSSIRIESYSTSDGVSKAKATAPPAAAAGSDKGAPELQRNILSNLEANASSQQQGPERRVVRSVKVIGDTDHTVSLNWRAPAATNTTSFSVLYAVFGERDMRRISVSPGKNRITIEGPGAQNQVHSLCVREGPHPQKRAVCESSPRTRRPAPAAHRSSLMW